ncbi:hypothetical protein ACHAPQ_009547 [Fusarium lateritium]
MESQKKSLSLGESLSFEKVFDAGTFILFYSPTYNLLPDRNVNTDNTSLNIHSAKGDHLLHISFRRAENQIAFNSKPTDSSWGPEERVSLQGVFSKTDATIGVRLEADFYNIYIDDSIIHTYKKRIIKDAHNLSYSTASESLFTNPIEVEASTTKRMPASRYKGAYFLLLPKEIAEESEKSPFDYVIIGSGIGGGMLATDLLEKNHRMSRVSSTFSSQAANTSLSTWNLNTARAATDDTANRTKRILIVERSNLLFPTHSLNMPRPTSRGTYG